MDLLYEHDRKLDYLDETDMVDFLDSNDIFQTPVTGFPTPEECYENDWLTSFLDDPVLNDKMMTDAMQPPCIKSEHSYSINDHGLNSNSAANNSISSNSIIHGHGHSSHDAPGSPLGLAKCEDIDTEFFGTSSALDLTIKVTPSSHPKSADALISTDAFLTSSSSAFSSLSSSSLSASSISSSSSLSSSLSTQSFSSSSIAAVKLEPETMTAATSTIISSRQPTIIVTTTSPPSSLSSSSSSMIGASYLSADLNMSDIEIKEEPMDHIIEQNGLDSIGLPPTPPGSSGSDSDGSQSPQRSAPSSPVRLSSSSSLRHHHSSSPLSPGKPYSQPLFVNPISQSGVLLLSEEEKRTLISEGYPIPSKLPLTKQEEKNLKKIRRKIKNKISAQESRRKKKEYLEALEKRVEAYNHENCDLKKKVESLESSNRSLIGQLQKLQSLVKMPKASQTGTALMVLVFCFAVFLGSLSPSSLNIGYATTPSRLGFVAAQQPHQASVAGDSHSIFHGPEMGPMMMTAHDTSDPYDTDPYSTPKLKSRMLMSVDVEEYCDDFRAMPWDSAPSCPMDPPPHGHREPTQEPQEPEKIVPGIDLMGGANLAPMLKTSPSADTTVVMVMAGMDNQSHSQEVKVIQSVIPDVTLNTKDILRSGDHHRMANNFTTELETA